MVVDKPRLLDRRKIATELGITLCSAETLMRQVDKVRIGRRVFITRDALEDYLKRSASR